MKLKSLAALLPQFDTALGVLSGAGVVIPVAGRLRQARDVIESTLSAGSFPAAERPRKLLVTAVRDASEWTHITGSLGASITGELLRDLQRAMNGPLLPPDPGGEPQELQSQLFFGSVLTESGDLKAPTDPGFPDFVHESGSLLHGVEVKSPSSTRGIQRAVSKADRQLSRLSGGGMLVLDASHLLGTALSEATPLLVSDPKAAESTTRRDHRSVNEELRRRVEDRGSWHRGRGVIATASVARACYWEVGTADPGPAASLGVHWRRYYRTRGTLGFWRATELGERVGASLSSIMPGLSISWER